MPAAVSTTAPTATGTTDAPVCASAGVFGVGVTGAADVVLDGVVPVGVVAVTVGVALVLTVVDGLLLGVVDGVVLEELDGGHVGRVRSFSGPVTVGHGTGGQRCPRSATRPSLGSVRHGVGVGLGVGSGHVGWLSGTPWIGGRVVGHGGGHDGTTTMSAAGLVSHGFGTHVGWASSASLATVGHGGGVDGRQVGCTTVRSGPDWHVGCGVPADAVAVTVSGATANAATTRRLRKVRSIRFLRREVMVLLVGLLSSVAGCVARTYFSGRSWASTSARDGIGPPTHPPAASHGPS
jgi:hypothetical protein